MRKPHLIVPFPFSVIKLNPNPTSHFQSTHTEKRNNPLVFGASRGTSKPRATIPPDMTIHRRCAEIAKTQTVPLTRSPSKSAPIRTAQSLHNGAERHSRSEAPPEGQRRRALAIRGTFPWNIATDR